MFRAGFMEFVALTTRFRMALRAKHRIILSYFLFITGVLCIACGFYLAFKELDGIVLFCLTGLVLSLWSTVLLTSNKISVSDLKDILMSIRGQHHA